MSNSRLPAHVFRARVVATFAFDENESPCSHGRCSPLNSLEDVVSNEGCVVPPCVEFDS